nr:PREDICTED: lysosomal-associated transmembrane protein 4A [Bemisia tabaci]XP_018896667.1 PREDICTED: lysosomal-associated transmembrane protein 4A [Bemisia tabaci]XP_018896668.1 PREDICTED: lysosomal-associated transmembrane protein 4A [Bemisia tabaci]
MKALQLKMGLQRQNKYWRTVCCHVRSAALFYGVFHLMVYMLTLVVILVNDRFVLERVELSSITLEESDGDSLAVSDNDFNNAVGIKPDRQSPDYLLAQLAHAAAQNMFGCERFVGVVATLSACGIALLFVYGVCRGKPGCMIPFFCFQVFDFLIESFFVMGYICSFPVMEVIVSKSMMRFPVDLSPRMITILILLSFVATLLVKSYFIRVMFNCYKFFVLRQTNALRTVNCIEPPMDNQSLLPSYAAAATKYFPPPPPDYATACAQDFPKVNDPNPIPVNVQAPPAAPNTGNAARSM